MKIESLLNEEVKSILTEESLNAIQEAFDSKVTLEVESALAAQDKEHGERLVKLINDIDKDRATKMKNLVEAVDKKHASQLLKLVKMFEKDQVKDAKAFKKMVVESVDAFLDEFLNETISKEDLEQAVKNKTAFKVLENMRSVLSVDAGMVKESVQSVFLEGKKEHDKVLAENKELKKQFKALYEQYQQTERNMLLETKISKFSPEKQKFIRKALGDKTVEFINENFDYTLRIFDKKEKETLKTLKEEALANRVNKPDVVILEKNNKTSLNNNEEPSDPFVDGVLESLRNR